MFDQEKLASSIAGALLSLLVQQTELLLRKAPVFYTVCDKPPLDSRQILFGFIICLILVAAVCYRRRATQLIRLEPIVLRGNGRRRT